MRLTASDLKDIQLFKYYRLVRRWACRQYDLKDADLELLIYLDCKERFVRRDFEDGAYTYTWDKRRWNRLLKNGWIVVWRKRDASKDQSYHIYTTSRKCKLLIKRMYRILLGEEDIPTGENNVFFKNKSYSDKVYNKAINDMIKDPDR